MPKSIATSLALLGLALTLTLLWLFVDDESGDAAAPSSPHAALADAARALPDATPHTDALAQPSALVEPDVAPEAAATAWPEGVIEIRLSGRVVDELGAPWPGAQVVFAPDRLTLRQLPELAAGLPGDAVAHYPRTLTDAAGRFELRGPRFADRAREGTSGPLDPMLVITGAGMAWHGYSAKGFRGESMDVGDLVLRHPGASFALRTVDDQGAPLPGVLVNAGSRTYQSHADDDPAPPNAFQGYALGPTDADGRVLAEHLWPSTLYASLEKEGYEAASFELTLEPGAHTDLGEFTLTRGRSQTGRVVDAAGRPVPDAHVVLVAGVLLDALEGEGSAELDAPATMFERFATTASQARTDTDGEFEIEGVKLVVDDALLMAAAPGFRHGMLRTTLVEGAPATVVLERSGVFAVQLRSAADGGPITDGVLRALQHTGFPEQRPPGGGYNSLVRPYAELSVDAGRVADVGALDVVLFAAAPGHLPQRVTPPRLAPREERTLEIQLVPGEGAHGRALDERGEPVADTLVELNAAAPFAKLWGAAQTHTDADGRFAFPTLLPGTWSGKASKPGHADAELSAFDSTESQPTLELRMPRGARVHGTLLDAAGEPAVARWLKATRDRDLPDELTAWARADRDGRYAFVGLQPGEWFIECAPGVETWVSVVSGDELTLDLQLTPPLRLIGTTRRGAELLPLVRVQADLANAPEDGERRSASTRSHGDGSYALELAEPGLYNVFFSAREGTRMERRIELLPGVDARLDVDFGTSSIAGRVTLSKSSAPLPARTRVVLRAGDERVDSMKLDAEGRFRFAPLPAGSYTLGVDSDLLLPLELGPLELAAGERREGLELRVEGAANVLLSVSTDDDSEFDGFVHLRRTTGGDEYEVRKVRSRARGHASFTLAPGTWRLDLADFEEPLLGHGEGRRGEPGVELPLIGGETISVTAGEQRRVDLTARAAALR